jgi:hypothetical protein
MPFEGSSRKSHDDFPVQIGLMEIHELGVSFYGSPRLPLEWQLE